MSHRWWIACALSVALPWGTACDGQPDDDATDDDATDDDSAGDDDTTPEECQENAGGALPEDVEWLVLDSGSIFMYSFADLVMSSEWSGYEGTYDLNTEEVYGANGFYLEAPATVYGAQVRWDNLLSADPVPVELWAFPDFSSDGYAFDIWNPIGPYTRCLTEEDEREWVTYAFPEPLEITQPLHLFVGYHRDPVETSGGEPDFTEPELLFDNVFNDTEPFYAGVRWPHVDSGIYHEGLVSSFYGWLVRLAVVYHDDIAPEDKPFQVDPALGVSSRVAWGDYDDDGDEDLMTNGPTLYRNEGDGTFVDVTAEAIPGGTVNGSGGGVWGDYDNDGCLDYFGQGTGYGAGEVLLHSNCDGTFTDVIDGSGISDVQSERDCDGDGLEEHSPTEGAAWLDVDGDGFLDLYLANYECSSEYDSYNNYDDRLFHNEGDGTFTDVSTSAGIDQTNQAGRGATTHDADRDGDTDLFISNYRLDRNFFYDNPGDGTLDDVASSNGTRGDNVSGSYGHTIGAAFGDIDGDLDWDLVAANLAHPFYAHFSDKTQVLINDGSGQFTDEAQARGIYYRETHSNPTLFDADNDGDLDLFITCVYAYRDSDLYLNDGSGNFTLSNYETGLVVQNGWGSAAADVDNDGDVDLVAYDLFRNETMAAGNHWIQIRAVGGPLSNRSAIGAEIVVEAGDSSYLRHVSGGSGTGCQDSMTQTVGLGTTTTVDGITVTFPGGPTVIVEGPLAADERYWIGESGLLGTGMTPP